MAEGQGKRVPTPYAGLGLDADGAQTPLKADKPTPSDTTQDADLQKNGYGLTEVAAVPAVAPVADRPLPTCHASAESGTLKGCENIEQTARRTAAARCSPFTEW